MDDFKRIFDKLLQSFGEGALNEMMDIIELGLKAKQEVAKNIEEFNESKDNVHKLLTENEKRKMDSLSGDNSGSTGVTKVDFLSRKQDLIEKNPQQRAKILELESIKRQLALNIEKEAKEKERINEAGGEKRQTEDIIVDKSYEKKAPNSQKNRSKGKGIKRKIYKAVKGKFDKQQYSKILKQFGLSSKTTLTPRVIRKILQAKRELKKQQSPSSSVISVGNPLTIGGSVLSSNSAQFNPQMPNVGRDGRAISPNQVRISTQTAPFPAKFNERFDSRRMQTGVNEKDTTSAFLKSSNSALKPGMVSENPSPLAGNEMSGAPVNNAYIFEEMLAAAGIMINSQDFDAVSSDAQKEQDLIENLVEGVVNSSVEELSNFAKSLQSEKDLEPSSEVQTFDKRPVVGSWTEKLARESEQGRGAEMSVG